MKIKMEHYEIIKKAITEKVNSRGGMTKVKEIYAGLSKKKMRLDMLYFSVINGRRSSLWISDVIYQYANDDHIDTVLRKIVDLPELQ